MLLQLFENINFNISLIAFCAIFVCSFTVIKAYHKLRLKTIFLYYFGIMFLAFACIGMTFGTLAIQRGTVEQVQSILFSITWVGIFFIYLGVKSAKGPLYDLSSSVVAGLIGGIITAYFSQEFYNIEWDTQAGIWQMTFHPFLLCLIMAIIVIVCYELLSFGKIILIRSRQASVKRNLGLFFAGWAIVGISGFIFSVSLFISEIPRYFYLFFFSGGIVTISISIYKLPASLIISNSKIYGIGLIRPIQGDILLFYDFKTGEILQNPLLITGFLSAFNSAMKESVRGCRYLKVLDVGSKKILIEWGFTVQIMMIAEKDTPVLSKILKRLLLLFEYDYFDILKQGSPDIAMFENFAKKIETYMAFAL